MILGHICVGTKPVVKASKLEVGAGRGPTLLVDTNSLDNDSIDDDGAEDDDH